MDTIFRIKVVPAGPSAKPADSDWINPPQVLTPFGIAAKFLVDEIGEVVPAAWKLGGLAGRVGPAT